MRRLPPALVLLIAAFSIPVAVELRTVFGFFGVEVPLVAIVVLEVLFLLALFVAYALGEADAKQANGTAR
jgi:hypothetical protein